GSGLTNLTPDEPMHRGEPIEPRSKPGTILYSAARTSAPTSYLYALDLAAGKGGDAKPKLVYTQAMPGGLVDVTADGTHVLFAEFHADDDVIVYEVEVATGKARRVFPAEGKKAGMYSAAYAGDGKRVLVATDDGDHVVLLALDAATGKELARYVDKVKT